MFSIISARVRLCEKISVFSIVCVSLLIPHEVAFAWADDDLQRAILDSRALGNQGANVTIIGTTAIVMTNRVSSDTDDQCKVKAILVAKTLMERKKTLALVRCHFVQSGVATIIDVGAAAIEAFASGITGKEKLLASIPLRRERIAGAPAATPQSTASAAPGQLTIRGKWNLEGRQNQLRALNYVRSFPTLNSTQAVREFMEEDVLEQRGAYNEFGKQFNKADALISGLVIEANKINKAREAASLGNSNSPVKKGDFEPERTKIWAQINDLKNKGKDVSQFEAAFEAIESNVGTTDRQILWNAITSLSTKLRYIR